MKRKAKTKKKIRRPPSAKPTGGMAPQIPGPQQAPAVIEFTVEKLEAMLGRLHVTNELLREELAKQQQTINRLMAELAVAQSKGKK